MHKELQKIYDITQKNITHSEYQLYFIQHATPEQLKEYYSRDISETERAKIINDTKENLNQEKSMYQFLNEHKDKIKLSETYEEYIERVELDELDSADDEVE